MYELHHLKGNTYYIDGVTNVGLYKLNDTDCVLIDCGHKEEGPVLESLLRRYKLKLKYIVNTHSHADHSGANLYLMKQTGCMVVTSRIERAFLRDSKLDIGFLYGGYPLDEYDSRLMHIDDQKEIYSLKELPRDLYSFNLPGHHYGMIGIRTPDGVHFVADSIVSKALLDTQHVVLIYDVKGYLETLDFLKTLDGNIIVPAHAEVTTEISDLVEYNRSQIYKNMDLIINYLDKERTVEDVTAYVFNYYDLKISYNKYMIITSTIKSYLSYLSNEGKIKNYFKNNKLVFISNEAFDDKF